MRAGVEVGARTAVGVRPRGDDTRPPRPERAQAPGAALGRARAGKSAHLVPPCNLGRSGEVPRSAVLCRAMVFDEPFHVSDATSTGGMGGGAKSEVWAVPTAACVKYTAR